MRRVWEDTSRLNKTTKLGGKNWCEKCEGILVDCHSPGCFPGAGDDSVFVQV